MRDLLISSLINLKSVRLVEPCEPLRQIAISRLLIFHFRPYWHTRKLLLNYTDTEFNENGRCVFFISIKVFIVLSIPSGIKYYRRYLNASVVSFFCSILSVSFIGAFWFISSSERSHDIHNNTIGLRFETAFK